MSILEKLFGSSIKNDVNKVGLEGSSFTNMNSYESKMVEFLNVIKKMSPDEKKLLRDFVNDVFGDVIKELKK